MKNDGRVKRGGIHFFAGALIMVASSRLRGRRMEGCSASGMTASVQEFLRNERPESAGQINDSAWRRSA